MKEVNLLDKEILIQYSDMAEEVKDIRKRIQKIQYDLNHLCIVSDSVKGTRPDGTYGPIKITGYPEPEHYRKKAALEKYRRLLELKETELLDLMGQAEEYIQSIEKSELRIMFRLHYIDDLTWEQVAARMNKYFPKRTIRYTEESCKKRNLRFFQNVPQCPEEIC